MHMQIATLPPVTVGGGQHQAVDMFFHWHLAGKLVRDEAKIQDNPGQKPVRSERLETGRMDGLD